jgi:hypothetical protein
MGGLALLMAWGAVSSRRSHSMSLRRLELCATDGAESEALIAEPLVVEIEKVQHADVLRSPRDPATRAAVLERAASSF